MFSVEYFWAGQTAVSVAATKASAGGAWNAQWPPADLSSAFSEDRGPKVKRIDVHVKTFYLQPIFGLRGPLTLRPKDIHQVFSNHTQPHVLFVDPNVTEAPKDSFGKVRCTKEEPTAKHFLLCILKGFGPPAKPNVCPRFADLGEASLAGAAFPKNKSNNRWMYMTRLAVCVSEFFAAISEPLLSSQDAWWMHHHCFEDGDWKAWARIFWP